MKTKNKVSYSTFVIPIINDVKTFECNFLKWRQNIKNLKQGNRLSWHEVAIANEKAIYDSLWSSSIKENGI